MAVAAVAVKRTRLSVKSVQSIFNIFNPSDSLLEDHETHKSMAIANLGGITGLFDAEERRPWVDSTGSKTWSHWRISLAQVICSAAFETIMIIIIVFNLGLIIVETDQEARCYPQYKDNFNDCPLAMRNTTWMYITNVVLLVLYSTECFLSLLVHRRAYFASRANWLDFGVCIVGWSSEIVGGTVNVSWLRIIRGSRVFRHPSITKVKELHMLVSGFSGSLRAVAYGGLLLFGALVFSSILVVQYVHPSNLEVNYSETGCTRCGRGFKTVIASSLTLFQQVIAGDSWGLMSIPNIEQNWKAAILLPLIHFVIGLGIMNLILAVIVDRAVEAREVKKSDVIKNREIEKRKRKLELLDLFEKLDSDGNGLLTYTEIHNSLTNTNSPVSREFKKFLLHSGVQREDLQEVFTFLDEKDDGEISYLSLCNALEELSHRETRVVASLAKISIHNRSKIILTQLDNLSEQFTTSFSRIEKKLDRVLNRSGLPEISEGVLATGKSESMRLSQPTLLRNSVDSDTFSLQTSTTAPDSRPSRSQSVQVVATSTQDVSDGTRPHGMVTLAQQRNMTTATVTVAHNDDLATVRKYLEDLKIDMDRQFQMQEANRIKLLKTELCSILSSLRFAARSNSSINPLQDVVDQKDFYPISPRSLDVASPGHATIMTPRSPHPSSPRAYTPHSSCISAAGLPASIGKHCPAEDNGGDRRGQL